MRKKLFFWPFFAALAITGCSSDESLVENPVEKPVFSSDNAYMAVNIVSANTRATDGGFEYGSANEHEVTSADFYFYDAEGVFVTQANIWNGGNQNPADPDENIEYFGNSVVVLKGLTGKNYPKYLVTVLNQPSGFKPGTTLAEMEGVLTGTIHASKNEAGEIKGFVMTTTSWVNGLAGPEGQPVYFANELQEGDFVNDPGSVADPVDIYVERLAAKVTLKVDDKQLSPVDGEKNTYEMKVTIAGDPNASTQVGAETIRVKFDNWGLNATAKQSHVVKNIDLNWGSGSESLGFIWSETSNYRTLWGMGTAYGEAFDADGTYASKLNYNTFNEMNAEIGSDVYCAENTNTSTQLTGHLAEGATSVLLAATVLYPVKTETGEITGWEPRDLMRYSGVLYEEDHFKNYVLNNLKTLDKLNYWKQTGENEYTQIGADDLEFENLAGMAQLKLVSETGWYKQTVSGDTKNYDTPADVSLLKTELEKFEANAFKGGKMYYNIPIEHMRPNASLAEPKEAHYGVVRNHHYLLTINKLENLGKGVYDPEKDTIIPEDPSDPKNKYQVGVEINVLSWKIVSQNVPL